MAQLHDGAALTLTSAQAAEAARILSAARVVALHCEGWSHYTEGPGEIRSAFDQAGLGDRLAVVGSGEVEL